MGILRQRLIRDVILIDRAADAAVNMTELDRLVERIDGVLPVTLSEQLGRDAALRIVRERVVDQSRECAYDAELEAAEILSALDRALEEETVRDLAA